VRVGVFTALLSQMSLDDVLKKLKSTGVNTVELGTGNYPGDPHCKLSMLDNPAELDTFKKKLADNGFSISALSCHGNALHPDAEFAKTSQDVNEKTVRLAEKLGVPVVIDFSGCPGDSDNAKYPNWVTCPWPPDFLDVLDWQWEKKVIPYWTKRAKFAADHGVKIAIEMHPGFVAYSPETMLKLRSIYERNLPITGVLDTKKYTDEKNRSWIFRTCGYGHDAEWWKEFVSTLRMFGYDYVLSVEHEDSLMSPEEGLTKAVSFLNGLVIKEQPTAAWWV